MLCHVPMRGIVAVWLVATGCVEEGKDVRIAHVAALAQAQVTIEQWPDGHLHASFDFPGGAISKTCSILAGDVQATWGGVPVATIERGSTGPQGADRCYLPTMMLPAIDDPALAGLDALVDLTVFDGTSELHLVAVGALAPRRLVPDGGKVVAGTTAVLRWTSTTDTWLSQNAKDGGDGIGFECDDPTFRYGAPIFRASTVDSTYWTPLHVDGDVFSFDAIEERPYAGTMACKLSAIAYAQIAQCDFADCEQVTTPSTSRTGAYVFTLEK